MIFGCVIFCNVSRCFLNISFSSELQVIYNSDSIFLLCLNCKIKRTHPQCSECVQNVRILSVSLKNLDNLPIYFYTYLSGIVIEYIKIFSYFFSSRGIPFALLSNTSISKFTKLQFALKYSISGNVKSDIFIFFAIDIISITIIVASYSSGCFFTRNIPCI